MFDLAPVRLYCHKHFSRVLLLALSSTRTELPILKSFREMEPLELCCLMEVRTCNLHMFFGHQAKIKRKKKRDLT